MAEGAKFFELPLRVWDDVHRVGLRSHYVASYYAAPLLLKADTRPLRLGSLKAFKVQKHGKDG